jgi:hypothetical protein
MKRRNAFLGPTAPWIDDSEGDTVYPMLLRSAAEALADRLEVRVALLRSPAASTDEVLMEIRRQVATCALDDPILASDLAELMLELLHSREHAKRAM